MASTSGGGEDDSSLSQPVVAVTTFCNYLKGIVPFVLQPDCNSGPSPAFLEALEKQSQLESIRKFLSDPQVSSVLIERHSIAKDEAGDDPSVSEAGGDGDNATYSISVGVEYSTAKKTGIAFIKRGAVVEAEKPIAYQLRVMNLSDDSPFETLHSYVRHAVTPLFNSFVKLKSDREGDKMVPSVAKQISELEVSLLHLQQNIDIPDVTLVIHPSVQAAVKKANDAGQKPSVDEFKGLVEDSTFLNALQKGVNRWIQEIQKVTKLDRDPASGTALQEVAFWLNLERALQRIQEKRVSPEVTLTLDILKHGKRFHATVSFDADTGLRAALQTVNEYNLLMKDFPIKDLLAANDLPSIASALVAIFAHLRKVRTIKYPVQRTLRLVEAISRDLFNQLLQVLSTRRLMHISFDEFEKVMVACFAVFNNWDDEYDKLQTLLRDIVKRKRDESLKIIMRINPQHKKLQSRLDQMRKFRRQHDQLRNVIVKVLRPTASKSSNDGDDRTEAEAVFDTADANAIEEVNLAYEHVKEVDGLDLGKQGTDAWDAAQKRYDERIDRVEARITARLRDQLGTAKNANEMFRIFSRFNALFVRPHIRGAIREYQTQLIQRVKDDIEALHDKFKVQYVQSMACRMSNVRDLPPVSGSIIWARQIERQLNAYMQRVEDVLGEGWKDYVEGQRLKTESDSFRQKLNTQQLFEDWQQKTIARPLGVTGRIFAITGQRGRTGGSGNTLKLSVNFLPDIITLSKEVRNLKWLNFRVPLTIVNKAHQANQLYPFAISLIESVRTYSRTCERVDERPAVAMLVARLKKGVQDLIQEGVQLGWESYKLDPYVHRLSDLVVQFQEKVDELLTMEESIAQEVRQLEGCQFAAAVFRGVLQRIQKAVDELNLHSYSNLSQWVATLDEQVEQHLATRCELALEAWTAHLKTFGTAKAAASALEESEAPTQLAGYRPEVKGVRHEIRITNQVLYLNPPVEHTRSQLLLQLHQWLGILTSLPRIQSSRYTVGVERVDSMSTTYRNLLARLPAGTAPLHGAYEAIEARCREVEAYVKVWLQYQSLWDMEPNHVYGILGEDLAMWQQLLVDIRRARSTFDTSETNKHFGPVVIDYRLVQSKVNLKYDSWHKDILSKFGQKLGGDIQELHGQISKARTDLEQHSVEGASTGDSVTFITFVQSLKRKTKTWEKNVELYRGGQKILERQRFQFPSSWLYCDHLDGEWSSFNDILARKDGQIQRQLAQLQMKIVSEDKQVEERTTNLLADWERGKPIQGNIRPDQAQSTLSIFEGRFNRLKEERDNLAKAKEALELSEPGLLAGSEERVHIAIEELQDLKGVWAELAKIWEQLETLKEQQWLSIQPRKIRRALEELVSQLKALPARLRQYASYEHVQGVLKSHLKVNMMIVDLKSEALKERHWKQLMRRLRVSWVLSDLTLGQLWDVNLARNETVVKEIVLIAQGEMALEEFLKQVREAWQLYELDLINYQNKCKVIRGLEDLFNKVREHINSVSAMKLSPYFKVFEEDALAWEDKLNRINNLFEVWQDVQRRWVYLDGIFSGSADIKHLLPVETSRFGSLSTEFLALMKKVAKSPLVLDVLNIPGSQRSLERLQELLHKIQKALGEYLERERASFPRFYFVGDEDLLEIIGNSRNFARLQKHFRKMFAGVNAIILNAEETIVTGLMSREGEEVVFETPVSIEQHPKINEWLTLVEREMRVTLATHLAHAVEGIAKFTSEQLDAAEFMKWADCYEAQLVVLAAQIAWASGVEASLKGSSPGEGLKANLAITTGTLSVLADSVLHEQPPLRRKKLEHLITELVHQRDVTRLLINNGVDSPRNFEWLQQMRFYFDPAKTNVLEQLSIHMANAKFNYGFEYLGVTDKLVQTPLTDRCYLTMTQALEERLGGSPFGPAGTGKTESVKALGNQLGRFVLVFNCDETFDFQAMGRIFVGLCQVGAWGCFDEFNRLEERMLSAVSQQIQTIQEALKEKARNANYACAADSPICIELVGKQVKVSTDMAIFITMNPGYAGRSNLPDNLKKLFRSLAMTKPDRQLIAQVMLFSQGFRTAEKLASKIVPFFRLCDEQLSSQSHYDFGLRALKSVLVSAGNVKRDRIQHVREETQARGEKVDEATIARSLNEQEILIQSVCETMVPKLVAEDIPLLYSLLSDVFPGIKYTNAEMAGLRRELKNVCKDYHLMYGDSDEMGSAWVDKVLQLYQISQLSHGLMMVGPSGSGKSAAWTVLLRALERLEGVEGVSYVIDPKAISKEDLYGSLDPNTREWTDGLFTHILRKITDNVRGEMSKRQWIIFDGDVDPEWVENLNSVLDDNKLLTLPNGERISIPPNVRIMFEVQDLKFATLATVSRCGMVWFSEDILSTEMICWQFLEQVRFHALDDDEDSRGSAAAARATAALGDDVSETLKVQRDCATVLAPHFASDSIVMRALKYAEAQEHIMDYTRLRALSSLFSMVHQAIRDVLSYNQTHPDFPLTLDQIESYLPKRLLYCLIWSLCGDSKLKTRNELGEFLRGATTIQLPSVSGNLGMVDYEVTVQGEWMPWVNRVPQIEVETHKVGAPDVVVPTVDTIRHENLLNTWLSGHKPLVLCGPPGSGKTMTLLSALRALPDMEVVSLNFSSATTPELLLKTFDHYCEYRRTPNGVVLSPIQLGKWLILFCDEINLPDMDKYGTQRVISFIRQMVEHNGFWRSSDQTFVRLDRIQFVGACNPPTDPGRKPLSQRFLRHVPVVYVDYPGRLSLTQIYGTFNRAMLRLVPTLRQFAQPLTDAMVEFYIRSQERFTVDMQPHYVYSPREMTRWVRGIAEALRPLDTLGLDGLVRIWAHEALRLFQDRLVYDEERKWTDEHINAVALQYFPGIDRDASLKRPILFSNWLSKDYKPVEREELRDFTKARLKVFYEEELDVPLVLFNEVLDHVLRIDRIFRQPQGHLLLIGVSGAGKTTLSRFVAWMNGLQVFQVKVHNKYTAEDFDEDLRNVLRRAGCRGEKICFIMDESNVLDSSFLERMNTLLANGEVPGLFEGDEYTTLMTQCKEGSQRDGLMLDSAEELYKWFTNQIMLNLHVVFTMNPSAEGLKDRAATSPALFNRCVLNWFGDWSTHALFQVGREFTQKVDLESSEWRCPDFFPAVVDELPMPPTHRDAVSNAFVYIHQTLHQANTRLSKRGAHTMAVTPRHYLDFIQHYVKLFGEKRSDLEDQQLHLNVGLNKIRETEQQVSELKSSLAVKKQELEEKNLLANQKLKQMVKDQQEAEKKKTASQEIQEQLRVAEEHITVKHKEVSEDLAKVEPAVLDAQNAVRDIKRNHLVEMRTMTNPPRLVKLTLEAVCGMLGEPTSDWKAIRGIIMRDNFINSIINFSTEDISDGMRKSMKDKYFSLEDFKFEQINRSSRACGPLAKWAIAQVGYADMLKKVDPLRQELSALERRAAETKLKADEMAKMVSDLEKSIGQYKEEYAVLISEAQVIKASLTAVESKVTRSNALLYSLGSERNRWEEGSTQFKTQMSTIIGDVLLSAAFMAYAGYFDQSLRGNLFSSWVSHLQSAGVQFRLDIARTEYLSSPDDRMAWQENALPTDDLSVENAIILQRFNRYPLIIDPSGQATEFVLNQYKDRKITRTSFLDDSFRKNLESALRFGNPLLVQDVENYDPILNPVLNREVRRTGGRVLITLGDQDIDLSPSFTIILSTRDPSVEFPPDLCSRVTFVNFTVTPASLQTQCLNQVLKSERPDVDQKRSDLLKLQGEFRLRLRQLEKSLLQALNEVEGKILDNDNILSQLERLKKEAAEVQKKVDETDIVMAEIEAVSHQYLPLATSCSSIFFMIDSLQQIHFLYQFSLAFFLDIFHVVLSNNPNLKGKTDPLARLDIIIKDLFQVVFDRVARSLLQSDRVTLALLLVRIFLKGCIGQSDHSEEFDYLLRGGEAVLAAVAAGTHTALPGLTVEQTLRAERLSKLQPFIKLLQYIDGNEEFTAWLETVQPERNVPDCWEENLVKGDVATALHRVMVVQAFRPDRLVASSVCLVESALGASFMRSLDQDVDLGAVVTNEVKASTPVLLCCVTGYDASGRVDDLATQQTKQCTSIAIGSAEGFSLADKAILSASKAGRWVLLKNVHLAPQWLVQLEKKLHALTPHPDFRLFMTMEINPKVPYNLLRASRMFTFEPPPGVRSNLLRTFSSFPATRMAKAPNERARLYFLIAWFHAIIQERLRYAPLGWSKVYEFNESDLRMACDTLDTWLDNVAQGRSNLPPDKIPWSALRTLVSQCIYGGRIDNEFDQRLMNAFVNRIFNVASFESEFALVAATDGVSGSGIAMPDCIRREQFLHWVEELPPNQVPAWLGLPNNAEKVLLNTLGGQMLGNLLKMQGIDDGDDLAYSVSPSVSEEKAGSGGADWQPAWMKTLRQTSAEWLAMVPEKLTAMKRTAEHIKNPLFRFFEREVNMGIKFLSVVRRDLTDLVQVCENKKKQTNYMRTLISDLTKGLIPNSWRRYTVPRELTVMQWMVDFSQRIQQLERTAQAGNAGGPHGLKALHIWLGGLFIPEAFITASRQHVAQANSWPLEELELQVFVSNEDGSGLELDQNSFGVSGMQLLGAACQQRNHLALTSSIRSSLPLTNLRWDRIVDKSSKDTSKLVTLPVYLNSTRSELLFTLQFTASGTSREHDFYEHGVALICSLLG
ncbi:cytoplasmic dynein 1 heavy chain 1-like [Sycon ciliatum]|uniref:cytoplasmic dynein 1 heavy chain 1-like n=1 Tax=Sycon ciliatum TaxID=27933 RepID=UPI0031F6B508